MLRRNAQSGYTLAELVMVAAVMVALAAVVMPVVKYTAKRTKEMELRAALREMRAGIDEYKRYSGQETQVPAPDPHRSDDGQGRMGQA
jgi:general secretion pathway protein G